MSRAEISISDILILLEVLARRPSLTTPEIRAALIKKGMLDPDQRVWTRLEAIKFHYIRCERDGFGDLCYDLTKVGRRFLEANRSKGYTSKARGVPKKARSSAPKKAPVVRSGPKPKPAPVPTVPEISDERIMELIREQEGGGILVGLLEIETGLNGQLKRRLEKLKAEDELIVDPAPSGKWEDASVIATEFA